MDDLVRAGEQIDNANLTAIAFHEPKKLGEEFARLRARAVEITPPEIRSREAEELREKARQMVERLRGVGLIGEDEGESDGERD